jgi:hypothetical protein
MHFDELQTLYVGYRESGAGVTDFSIGRLYFRPS